MSHSSTGGKFTVGRLARTVNLSRTTLLYYHRIGLLRPTGRSSGNYRLYTASDHDRLQQVCFYRRIGVPLKDIARLLDGGSAAGEPGQILRRRLQVLESEISSLQRQQGEIIRLLNQLSQCPLERTGRIPAAGRSRRTRNKRRRLSTKEINVINKQRWVDIMSAADFSEDQMKQWHKTFERMEPEAHEEFLQSLGISPAEIARIRKFSSQ